MLNEDGSKLKAIILAGGLGTRLSEETVSKPKPMVEVGGNPLLWHVMKIYSHHGINDFIVCLGYRGYIIKEYFANYLLHRSDVTIDLRSESMEVHSRSAEPWRITLVDTGQTTNTGGRIKRAARYLDTDSDFCLTYGDGVTDADIEDEIAFHRSHGKLVTVLSVAPPGRYGALKLKESRVTEFHEKPVGDGGRISGGFFVVSRGALNAIEGDSSSWEGDTVRSLSSQGEVMAFDHPGFWKPVDTLREKTELDNLWNAGSAPWRVWE